VGYAQIIAKGKTGIIEADLVSISMLYKESILQADLWGKKFIGNKP
jgi:hypothetical protein